MQRIAASVAVEAHPGRASGCRAARNPATDRASTGPGILPPKRSFRRGGLPISTGAPWPCGPRHRHQLRKRWGGDLSFSPFIWSGSGNRGGEIKAEPGRPGSIQRLSWLHRVFTGGRHRSETCAHVRTRIAGEIPLVLEITPFGYLGICFLQGGGSPMASPSAAMTCTERSGRSQDRLGAGDFDEAGPVSGPNTGRPDFDTRALSDAAKKIKKIDPYAFRGPSTVRTPGGSPAANRARPQFPPVGLYKSWLRPQGCFPPRSVPDDGG